MRRFVLRENIRRFHQMLVDTDCEQEKARLQSFIDEARQELSILERLWLVTCPGLGISLTLGSEAEDMLDRAVIAHHADFGSLQIWDTMQQGLCLIAQSNFDHALVDRFACMREGDGVIFRTLRASKNLIVIGDIQTDARAASLRNWTTVAAFAASSAIRSAGKTVALSALSPPSMQGRSTWPPSIAT
jgi:hypothetical protein